MVLQSSWTWTTILAACVAWAILAGACSAAEGVPGLGAVGKATPATERPVTDEQYPADVEGTRLGDWGHFLSYQPRFYLNNPDGKDFTVTVHQMMWGMRSWNKDETRPLRLVGPDGKVIVEGAQPLTDAEWTCEVTDAAKGVYELACQGNVWVSSSLEQSVAWTGEPGVHIRDYKHKPKRPYYEKRGQLVFQASVPRRWWFYVPRGVTKFTCRAMRADTCMSQREDWGFFVVTPRGQRIRALWGQPPHTPGKEYHQIMTSEVEVEPGAGGRFWSLEVHLGDSHNYSNINFSLDGVPPYLARSPEEWFNAETGKVPDIDPYDDTPFIQSARIEEVLKEKWPNLQHFSPCPSLGDPDGVEIIGDATFALWNPQGRKLNFRIGTYLPRVPRMTSHVKIVGPKDKVVLEEDLAMTHVHGEHGQPNRTLETGKGVSRVHVTESERFLAFTYPATPLVLLGEPTTDGWAQFRITCGTARNWYFYVPKGTKEFSVRAAAKHATDTMELQVCAPDKVMDVIYDNSGRADIEVPPGLDGKIWHLRTDVGMPTRMVTRGGPDYRYLDMYLTIDVKGVPGYLAPTWEQWFDPQDPAAAMQRAGK